MRLSTFEIRISFISVFLFIDSILKNSAAINNNEIKDRNEEPFWRTSPHLEEVFVFGSMIGSNRPRSIYQYSNMGPRLSGLTSIFGVVFFVSKSPVGIERQKKLEKFAILTRKPRSHA